MSIYVCSESCGYSSKSWFGACPRCGQGVGVASEAASSIPAKSSVVGKYHANHAASAVAKDYVRKDVVSYGDASTYGKNVKPYTVIMKTPFGKLNDIFSVQGGILASQVILLAASPGVGKSTLCSQIANEDTIYISTEETESQIINRFQRCGAKRGVKIISTVDSEVLLGEVSTCEESFIVIDSLNNVENGSLSYVRVAQLAQEIVNAVKVRNKSIIIISQVTKNGQVIGMESLSHAVDTVIHMERSQVSEDIILTSSKNRFAEVGEIAVFRHAANGLEEAPDFQTNIENMNGTTPFTMVAGSKRIPIEIQCLICPSDGGRPIRRAIGVNANKLYIINGILQYHDKGYSTSMSDIYVTSSNGIAIHGGDLAIANSMLSSWYGKILPGLKTLDFSGNVNLNGTVTGNANFRHIRDLIRMYK